MRLQRSAINISQVAAVVCYVWCFRYWITVKVKVSGNVDLYSASSRTPLTRSDIDHTVLPANNTISAFTRKHSPGGGETHIRIANAWVQLTTHLSTPIVGWVGHVGWNTADGLPQRRSPVNCRPGKVHTSYTDVLTTVLCHQHHINGMNVLKRLFLLEI